MGLDRQPTRRVDGAIYLRDDISCIRAVALIAIGMTFAVLGLVPRGDLAVGGVGLACVVFGMWVLARPVGVVIHIRTASICVRGLVKERHVGFSDLSYIGVQPSDLDDSASGWLGLAGGRYDVVVHVRGDQALLARQEIRLSAARLVAEQLSVLTGAAVSESLTPGDANR